LNPGQGFRGAFRLESTRVFAEYRRPVAVLAARNRHLTGATEKKYRFFLDLHQDVACQNPVVKAMFRPSSRGPEAALTRRLFSRFHRQ
jgi:hypothetical protein